MDGNLVGFLKLKLYIFCVVWKLFFYLNVNLYVNVWNEEKLEVFKIFIVGKWWESIFIMLYSENILYMYIKLYIKIVYYIEK